MINREVADKLLNVLQQVIGRIELNQLDKARDAIQVLAAMINAHVEQK